MAGGCFCSSCAMRQATTLLLRLRSEGVADRVCAWAGLSAGWNGWG